MKFSLQSIALLFIGAAIFSTSCKKDSDAPNSIISLDTLTLSTNSYWNGSDNSGGFTCGNAYFANLYTTSGDYSWWSGFAYSNQHDVSTTGYTNQYSAYALNDASTNQFVVGYIDSYTADSINIKFIKPMSDCSFKVTNNTYAALSMKEGDAVGKKFETGDWFKLTITCYDANKVKKGSTEFYLAKDTTIVSTWSKVDLSTFGSIETVSFRLTSTDTGIYGMNTPSYFCLDDIEGNTVN